MKFLLFPVRDDNSQGAVLQAQPPEELHGYKLEDEPANTFTAEQIHDDFRPNRYWTRRRYAVDPPVRAHTATTSAQTRSAPPGPAPISQEKVQQLAKLQKQSLGLLKELGIDLPGISVTHSSGNVPKTRDTPIPLDSVHCPKCNKSFSTHYRVMNHYRQLHLGVTKWQCELCEKYLSSQANLDEHLEWVHKKHNFKCKKCSKYYSTKQKLTHHMSKAHHTFRKGELSEYRREFCLQVDHDVVQHAKRCKHNRDKSKQRFPCGNPGCHSSFNAEKHRNYHQRYRCPHRKDLSVCRAQAKKPKKK